MRLYARTNQVEGNFVESTFQNSKKKKKVKILKQL
jgi:hypothetical protein